MTKTSVFKLVSMKKGVERTHLEKLLMRLRLEHILPDWMQEQPAAVLNLFC